MDGRTLLLKDLSPSALTGRARGAKLDFLHDPRRELEVYRSLLDGADLGTPELAAAVSDPDRDRYWLVVEKVRGTELYQVGELERWQEALRWLARLHDRFVELPPTDFLVRYDRSYFELWPARAGVSLPGYEAVVDRLAALPTTLVHGELYASNVLVAEGRVCAVDWELAGVGPGVLDVAALTTGWPDPERSTARGGLPVRARPSTGRRSIRSRSELREPPPRGPVARLVVAIGRRRRSTHAIGGPSCRGSRSARACDADPHRECGRLRPQQQPPRRSCAHDPD